SGGTAPEGVAPYPTSSQFDGVKGAQRKRPDPPLSISTGRDLPRRGWVRRGHNQLQHALQRPELTVQPFRVGDLLRCQPYNVALALHQSLPVKANPKSLTTVINDDWDRCRPR